MIRQYVKIVPKNAMGPVTYRQIDLIHKKKRAMSISYVESKVYLILI